MIGAPARLLARILGRIGDNARLLIAVAPICALFLSELSALMRPALPYLVAAIYATAMVRINLGEAVRIALRPAALARAGALIVVLMVAVPWISLTVARAIGLSEPAQMALIYAALAPPFASAAAICFLLGANAALALELTILAALVAPLVGPLTAELLLGVDLPIDALSLSARIAIMIGAGALVALAIRRLVGPARIARNARILDGLAALIMIVFVIPVFDGVADMILASPWTALEVLGLVLATNLMVQVGALFALSPLAGAPSAATIAIAMGNRNVSLYLAALPANPYFSLFVALYQLPMYLTPVVMRRLMPRATTGT